MSKHLLLVDLDDTLVDTSHVYWLSRSRFVEALGQLGLDRRHALERFEELDSANMSLMGFDPLRYSKTMRDVCAELTKSGALIAGDELLEEVCKHGHLVLEQLPELIDGAIGLLEWARDRFTTVLYTRGEKKLQQQKIAHSAIGHLFHDVRIVKRKAADELAAVVADYDSDPRDAWVIGDSIRSDINPAVRIGANPILYAYSHPSYYWRQEYGVVPEGPFYKIDRLNDAPSVLDAPQAYRQMQPTEWMRLIGGKRHPDMQTS